MSFGGKFPIKNTNSYSNTLNNTKHQFHRLSNTTKNTINDNHQIKNYMNKNDLNYACKLMNKQKQVQQHKYQSNLLFQDKNNDSDSLFNGYHPSQHNSDNKIQRKNPPIKQHSQKYYPQKLTKNKHTQIINVHINHTDRIKRNQLFPIPYEMSFQKMQQIKEQFTMNSIQLTQQVNDIVDLIKGQRVQMKMIFQDLKKQLEDCYTYRAQFKDIQTNTQEIIINLDNQQNQLQQNQNKKDQNKLNESVQYLLDKQSNNLSQKSLQSYGKLVRMLQQIKINPNLILPKHTLYKNNRQLDTDTKQLTNKQILQLQQVFIKKLANTVKTATNYNKFPQQKLNKQN